MGRTKNPTHFFMPGEYVNCADHLLDRIGPQFQMHPARLVRQERDSDHDRTLDGIHPQFVVHILLVGLVPQISCAM